MNNQSDDSGATSPQAPPCSANPDEALIEAMLADLWMPGGEEAPAEERFAEDNMMVGEGPSDAELKATLAGTLELCRKAQPKYAWGAGVAWQREQDRMHRERRRAELAPDRREKKLAYMRVYSAKARERARDERAAKEKATAAARSVPAPLDLGVRRLASAAWRAPRSSRGLSLAASDRSR